MTRRYKAGLQREQGQLLPMRVEDYVSADNPVRALDAYVESLDLHALGVANTAGGVSAGQPAYPPAALLKLYLYGYLMRVRSSRRLAAECYRNLEVMWLLQGLQPCHKTIADFRRDNGEALQSVHRDFVQLCRELDLYGRELVAVDGSFFAGDAGGKGIHTRDQLNKRLRRIEADIAAYLQALEEADRTESGSAQAGDGAEALQDKLAALRTRQAREAERLARLDASGETQLSEVDADARRLCKNGQAVCGYNVQLAIDGRCRLIVDGVATNEGNDRDQLQPMAERARSALGAQRFTIVADTGYFNPAQLRRCAEAGAAGCSIEDWDGARFYPGDLAVERVAAAVEAAEALGDRIDTGTVYMNRCDYLDPALAWTGVKHSGRGCTLSVLGYEHLTRPKSFHLRTLTGEA